MLVYVLSIVLGVVCGGVDIALGWFDPWSLVRFPFWVFGSMLAVFILYWVAMWLFSLPIDMKKQYDKPDPFYLDLIRYTFGYGLAIFGFRVKLTGEEKIPKDARFLITANHTTLFDPLIVCHALRKFDLVFVTKPENYKIPIVRKYMHACRHLPIDRDDPRKAVRTINEAAQMISDDIVSIGIFPEGTRTKTGATGEFKAGSYKIAQKAKCPVVLAAIRGGAKFRKNFPFKLTPIEVVVEKVLTAEEVASMKTVEIAAMAESLVKKELGEAENAA